MIWIKCALPFDQYMSQETVLDRLNAGESLLIRENFKITMISLVFANIYVVMTFIICDFTQDQQMGWLVHIELFFLLLVAQHFAWMQFSIQVYLFQIFTLTFVLVGFFCMLFIVSAGVICYGTISFGVSVCYLFLIFPASTADMDRQFDLRRYNLLDRTF